MHLAYGGESALPEEELEGITLHPLASLVRPIAPWKDTVCLWELRKLIDRVQPDLVATHSTKAGLLGRLAAWTTGTPDVHTVHGWSVSLSGNRLKRFIYSQIEGKTHRLANGIICVSAYDKQHAERMGLTASKLKLIYNGRPDAPSSGREAGNEGYPRIVSVGRMAWPKQPEQLLRLLTKEPAVHLDIIGDGPREEMTRQLAEDLDVSDRVIFHGHVANIYPILNRADIFALVSDWEGFPMSTLEAMSVGLPTVVSSVGGAPEAIVHGVTGYAIARGDEDSLHRHLSDLVHDAEKRRTFGVEARRLFDEKFRLDTMVADTLEFYAEILSGR
jgi:glycosyltransferase involved in cell wall biosynthesis